jgi:hypothetical protein
VYFDRPFEQLAPTFGAFKYFLSIDLEKTSKKSDKAFTAMTMSITSRYLTRTLSLQKPRLVRNGLSNCRWSSSLKDDDSLDGILSLPLQYLRAKDSSNIDESTYQRLDVPYDSATGKPGLSNKKNHKGYSIEQFSVDGDDYKVLWSDGLSSRYSVAWVQRQLDRWKEQLPEDRQLWSNLNDEDVRNSSALSIPFSDLITDTGMNRAVRTLYQYGVALVTGTPIDDNGAGVAALGAALGGGSVKEMSSTSILANYRNGGTEIMLSHGTDGPLRTLYGTVWSTSSEGQADGASVADSAYGSDGLPLHTDLTYFRDPPGLQIFTMVQPAIRGGASVFADGFAVADQLRSTDPEAFEILSSTVRRYRCLDKETGWHLEASGPVIQVRNGQVVGIRHNDLDRLPDLPPASASEPDEIDAFYEGLERAHASWDSLLAQDKFRLVMKLQPGDTMVVANQVSFEKCTVTRWQGCRVINTCRLHLILFLAMLSWKMQFSVKYECTAVGDGMLHQVSTSFI